MPPAWTTSTTQSAHNSALAARRRRESVIGTRPWSAAIELANSIAAGGDLPVLPSPVLFDGGEVLHADIAADGWRFHAVEITYEVPHVVAVAGPLMFGVVTAAGAVARRRARRVAEALAIPQWRPLGPLRVLATDRRLLVSHDAAWASVWYHAIREVRPHMDSGRLDLTFDDDPPYSLAGPWVPYLAVVVTTILAGQRGLAAVADALADPISG